MKVSRTNVSPLMKELSRYIASALRKPLPSHVVERAKLQLVDTLAAMISGSRLPPGKKVAAYVEAQGGKPEASVIGSGIVTSAANAALANGMFAHADEVDDTHPASLTHPGRAVVPAALAIGERNRVSGTALLRAIVLGYDICARVPLALKPMSLMRAGHYVGAFGGVFGAAAASAALLGADELKARYVLSYAAQQAAGLTAALRDPEHVQKAFAGGGMPAHNGATSALMVEYGFTGVEDIFSGEHNFFSTFSTDADGAVLTHGLGDEYEILRSAIKCWAVGGPIQGPLHVLRDLIREHGLKAGDVVEVVARMPDQELDIVNNRDMPNICVQHLLAVMLLDGTVTFDSAHDFSRMQDPQVLAVRKRIKTVGDPALTDTLRRWRCVMEITLKDGRKLEHHTMAAKGSFENPVTRQEEEEKALDLIAPVFTKRRALALLATVWDLQRMADVRSLRKFLTPVRS
jgi:2-methylcitrate dehydratase PrpD